MSIGKGEENYRKHQLADKRRALFIEIDKVYENACMSGKAVDGILQNGEF